MTVVEWVKAPCNQSGVKMDVFVGALILHPHRWAVWPAHLHGESFPKWMRPHISRHYEAPDVYLVAYTPKESS